MSEIKEKYKVIYNILNIIFGIVCFTAITLLIIIIGFYLNVQQTELVLILMRITTAVFVVQEVARWFIARHLILYIRSRWVENLLSLFIVLQYFLQPLGYLKQITSYDIIDITFVYFGILQLALFITFFVKIFRHHNIFSKIRLHPGLITALSFATVAFLGALFLMLPKASPIDHPVSFIDALFTSTSAVCVTGLNTIDTVTGYTTLGKIIIIILIQIGGIGVMTLYSFFASLIFGGLSYKMRVMVREILSEDNLSEISSVLKRITFFVLSIEFIGALFLYYSLGSDIFNVNVRHIEIAVFHSISAFCNAGFSIFTSGFTNPLVYHNYLFLSTIMVLIFVGGLGYIAFYDLFSHIFLKKYTIGKFKKRLSLTTRLDFNASFIIVFSATILIFLFENYSNEYWMNGFDKFFHSLFMVISARTAGFNCVDMSQLTPIVLFIVIVVMWIGASPGSTGGGIKTTTISVLLLYFINYVRGKDTVEIYNRRIDHSSIAKAQMVIISAFIVLFVCLGGLVYLQPNMSFMDLFFEAVSAISTTGLSTGITPSLLSSSKIFIILLMYIGRIGTLTFFMAVIPAKEELKYDIPDEKILIG